MGFKKDWYGATEHAVGGADTGDTEFSWGPGMVPPGYEHAPPRNGGMHIGRAPSMTEPRCNRRYRKGDPPRGYPGDLVKP